MQINGHRSLQGRTRDIFAECTRYDIVRQSMVIATFREELEVGL